MNKYPVVFLTCLCIVLFSCNQQAKQQAASPVTVDENTRIVSLNGTITEMLCAFGLEHKIVGVDITSNYPSSVLNIPQVGYVRSVAAEKILALQPTLVMVFKEGFKPEVQEQLNAANIKTIVLDQQYSVEGTKNMIRSVAAIFQQQDKVASLLGKIDDDLLKVKPLPAETKVLFIYARGAGTLMIAGNRTAAKTMIELAGGKNAVNSFDDFKPLTSEALVTANPDVILLFDSGLESLGGMDGLLKVPGIAQTNAGKNKRVIEMDGQFLAGFSPRVGEAIIELNHRLQ